MVNYRRNKTGNPDDIFFFTIVTQNRTPRFATPEHRDTIINAMNRTRDKYRLIYKAWVILPDHLHLLLKSPVADYSRVLWDFKRWLTYEFRRSDDLRKGSRLWQDRFWEETVRDDDHYERCVDYIHFNPVRHGLVKAPVDWKHSSIHWYIRRGYIPPDWGYAGEVEIEGVEYD